jgi:chromosome segregation ATPase
MTSTRYLLCRVALTFGYSRKNIRMGDAAGEMHLLKEAEAHLGEAIWKNVEDIESLSVEYWNLRKLAKERERVAKELAGCQKELDSAHEERSSLLGVSNEPFQDLMDERQRILNVLEELAKDRDLVVAKAREIRRSYDGIKTKHEVLEKENSNSPEEQEKAATKLASLKKIFASLKGERHVVAQKIAKGDARIDAIDAEILTRKKERRAKASEAFQHIGDANQEMSTYRAELGLLDTQMRQLYSEIGRHVSRSAENNPECRKACEKYQGMVDVMRALRKSIQMNHALAEMS